jgi:hypothetical protein
LVEEPGLTEFLEDPALSGTATEAEIAFLKRLKFRDKRPTPLYYYRELQNLRDSLHFRPVEEKANAVNGRNAPGTAEPQGSANIRRSASV